MPEIKRRLGVRGALVETVFNVTGMHGLEDLSEHYGFTLPRADLNATTEFPFRAEFGYDEPAGLLRFAIHHHANRFSPVQVARIAGYYLSALRAIGANPDARHDQASLMDPVETALVTGGFGGRRRPLPAESFVEVVDRVAAAWPDRVALVHRDQRMDYASLHAAARDMAGRLRAHGLGPGDACALALPRGVPWAVSVLAVLMSGGVYVPLDPTHPPARIAAVTARAGAVLLVTENHRIAAIGSALAERAGADRCRVVATDTRPGGGDGDGTGRRDRASDDDAYILFTSGSTGEPKGARITHAGMLNHLLAKVEELDLGPDDRVAQTASQSFDISVWQLLAAWMVGGRTVVYDTGAVTDAPSFLDALAADGATVMELVPSHLDALLAENARRPRALPALRYGMVTGEPVPVPLVRRWFEQFGVPLVNAYGPTEAADDVTHLVLRAPVAGSRVPVGTPIPNIGIHVVGPDGRHRPIGCYGEIVITGVGVGRGYVNDPERTAEAFAANTLDVGSALMYRSGDVGRWLPGGVLDCAGRLDSQVKLRGFRIELAEVEGAVTAMSGVDSAVAVVTSTGRLVVGYLGSASLEVSEVRRALARTLPDYMLPDAVAAIEGLPLGPNGKVDRAALSRVLLPSAARRGAVPAGRPMASTERFVAGLFAQVLGAPVESVGLDDVFFGIGGHSLAAMKLAARSDGRLTLRDIVTRPTVRSLAAMLDSGGSGSRPLLIPLTRAAAGAPALVCAPYAGGGAVNFVPLARKLAECAPDLAVYGIEPPGRTLTDPLQVTCGLEQTITAVADEVAEAGHRWVAVFGHCSGSVLGLLLARLLDERGVTVNRVFTAAKVLPTAEPADYADEEFERFSDEQVADWVRNKIGMAELDEMSATEIADMAQAFRVDSAESNRILCQALRAPEDIRVGCPVTQVVALDDEITAGHATAARNWELFAPTVTCATLPDGGHYFNRTRPEPLAALVASELGLPGGRPGPAGRLTG
jgi:amino acid adenylation domain-containing protein